MTLLVLRRSYYDASKDQSCFPKITKVRDACPCDVAAPVSEGTYDWQEGLITITSLFFANIVAEENGRFVGALDPHMPPHPHRRLYGEKIIGYEVARALARSQVDIDLLEKGRNAKFLVNYLLVSSAGGFVVPFTRQDTVVSHRNNQILYPSA